MNKYEYKVLEETATTSFNLDDVNKLGAGGWRVVSWKITDGGLETILFEREVKNINS